MKTELKPCPFCGRKPSKVKEYKTPSIVGIYYTVGCKGKGSRCSVKPETRLCNTPQAAIEAWNRRTVKTPCDLCKFNPPSSMDGKPCTMCVADGRNEDGN